MSWPRLFASYAGFFALFNLAFATAYQLQPRCIANLSPAGYWGRFFFSVETLATVGYGDMHPQTVYAHLIASVEIFFGLMSLALITGMMFARFSRPTARILFARHGVVPPVRRQTDAHASRRQRAAERHHGGDGAVAPDSATSSPSKAHRIRRIYDLPLRRSEQPMFLYRLDACCTSSTRQALCPAPPPRCLPTKAYHPSHDRRHRRDDRADADVAPGIPCRQQFTGITPSWTSSRQARMASTASTIRDSTTSSRLLRVDGR